MRALSIRMSASLFLLHGETLPIVSVRAIDQQKIERLIVVDTADPDRIGALGELVGSPGVEVVVFDHHEAENPVRPQYVRGENWVLSSDGAQASSMVHILWSEVERWAGSKPPSSHLASTKTRGR